MLDTSRLEKIKTSNGKTIARCPACAEAGEDRDGKHLAIFPDGRFACVTHPGEKDHRRRIFELAGVPDDPPPAQHTASSAPKKPAEIVPWPEACERLAKDESALERLAKWRGWTADFSRELARAGVIGLHEGRPCFPVHDLSGAVTGRHVFAWEANGRPWYVNGRNVPLVIGVASLVGVKVCHIAESQWDVLALLFARGWHGEALDKPFIATRGTSINPALKTVLGGVETVNLWMQNDAPKAEGKAPPCEEWLARCLALLPESVREIKRVDVAAGSKDWNDVLRERGPVEALGLVKTAVGDAVPLEKPAPAPEIQITHESAPPPDDAGLPEPQELPSNLRPVMPFNDAWLPESFRVWIADISERMQCPPDYGAAAVMTALSSVIGRRAAMQPKEHDTGWTEHANLWGLIVGDPGTQKSPTLQAVLRPLKRMEAESVRRHDEAEHERKAAALKAKMIRDAAAKEAAKAVREKKEKDFDFAALLPESGEDEETPLRRFIVNDCSLEALGEVMKSNPFGVMLYQDELAGALAMLERDGNQCLRAMLLQSWSAKEGFTFDRIIRGMRRVEHCCLSVLGGIQPGVLAEHFGLAQAGGAGGDGLVQRFSLLVWPDVAKDWRNVDKQPRIEGEEAAESAFRTLEEITVDDLAKCAPCDRDGVPTFRFAPDAQERFRAWHTELERRLRSGELSPAMTSHLAKYRKLVPALSLTIHLAEWQTSAVTLGALEKAIGWAGYLETHAARAYSCKGIAEADAARSLLQKLNAGNAGLPDEFTARQVRNKGWSGMSTPDEAEAACELLADCAWLLRRDAGRTAKGGRPTTLYRANPRALERRE